MSWPASRTTEGASPFQGSRRFRLETHLGQGGMGEVYRVFDTERGVRVAAKFLSHVSEKGVSRFKSEFRSLADLVHPNVVQLYELFADGESWYFTMEWVEGVDFVTYAARRKTLADGADPSSAQSMIRGPAGATDPPAASARSASAEAETVELAMPPVDPISGVRVRGSAPKVPCPVQDWRHFRQALWQLAEGVMAIHTAGLVHRDLKPSNVLVSLQGRVVILDFGLAGMLEHLRGRDEGVVGTPAYMAPEQGGLGTISAASDWYAVGVMLYEALTGVLPFEGEPLAQLMAKRTRSPELPSTIASGIPEDLEALTMALLAPTPNQRPGGRTVLAALRPYTPESSRFSQRLQDVAPFVGRQAEQARLWQAFKQARGGEPTWVSVVGESGVGKSALVKSFLRELRSSEEIWQLGGRCYERENVPFKAFDTIIEDLVRLLRGLDDLSLAQILPAGISELARVFPEFRGLPALDSAAPSADVGFEAFDVRSHGFIALSELLEGLCRLKPVVIYIDDLQWSDADSASLLAELLQGLRPPAVLWIATERSDWQNPAVEAVFSHLKKLGRSGGEGGVGLMRMELGGLNEQAAQALVERALGRVRGMDESLISRIAQECQGIPFYLNALVQRVQSAQEAGRLSELRRSWECLDDVVAEHVSELPEAAAEVLAMMAVASRPLTVKVALRALDNQEASLAALRQLQVHKLIRSRSERGEQRVETAHDRIRETTLRALSAAAHSEHHRRLADALLETHSSEHEAILDHLLGSNQRGKAQRHALIAAEQAEHALAFRRAARLYGTAIELGAAQGKPQLYEAWGQAYVNAGLGKEAAEAFQAGAERMPFAQSIDAQRRAAEAYMKSGYDHEGLAALRRVLQAVDIPYSESRHASIANLVLQKAWLKLRRLDRASMVKEHPDPAEVARVDVAFSAAVGLSMRDSLRGAEYAARHLRLALSSGDSYRICRGLALEASMTAAQGHKSESKAMQLVELAEGIAGRMGDPALHGFSLLAAGYTAFFVGRFQDARARLDEAERVLRTRCRGVSWELNNARSWACNAQILRGQLKDAAKRIAVMEKDAKERDDRFAQVHTLYPACITRLVADRPAEAERVLAERTASLTDHEGFTSEHWGPLVANISLRRYQGQGGRAFELMEAAVPRIQRSFLPRIENIRIFAAYERGLCALAAAEVLPPKGRGSQLKVVAKCAKQLKAEAAAYAKPMGDYLRAGKAYLESDQAAAIAHLRAACEGFEQAEMGYLAQVCHYRFGQLTGGKAGGIGQANALEALLSEGVKNPERCIAMSAPGFAARANQA